MSDGTDSSSLAAESVMVAALERLRVIQDEIMRGVAHAMSNRVGAMSAGVFVLGETGTATPAATGALQSELDRLEQLLVQLRMLSRETVEPEPLLSSDSARTAVALHEHHGELRNVSCIVDDAGHVPPARAEPQALIHALLVAITCAKQAAGNGSAQLVLRSDDNVVRFIATSGDADNVSPDDSTFAVEALAARMLLERSNGTAFAIAGGCVIEVPTLAASRRPRG